MWLTKVISLLVLSNVVLSIQEQNRLDDINLVLQPGYPGYKQPKFSLAPRQPEGRSLYYRKTPRVEKYRSAVHELYMRPYNYVSYEMGGSNPTQYNYHYETQHPNYPEYPSYHSSQHPSSNFPYHPTPEYNPQPDYHKPPEYHQQPEYPKVPEYPLVPEYNQPEYHQPQEYHHPSPYPEPYSPYQPTFYASPTPAPVSYSTLAPTIEYLPKTSAKAPTPEPTKLDVSKWNIVSTEITFATNTQRTNAGDKNIIKNHLSIYQGSDTDTGLTLSIKFILPTQYKIGKLRLVWSQ